MRAGILGVVVVVVVVVLVHSGGCSQPQCAPGHTVCIRCQSVVCGSSVACNYGCRRYCDCGGQGDPEVSQGNTTEVTDRGRSGQSGSAAASPGILQSRVDSLRGEIGASRLSADTRRGGLRGRLRGRSATRGGDHTPFSLVNRWRRHWDNARNIAHRVRQI